MPLPPRRTLRTSQYAVFFDGVDDYAVISPFTVYGWSEITIQERIYFYHPKANTAWSKFSMMGDYGADYPSTFFGTDNRYDYTYANAYWTTRTPEGTRKDYYYSIIAHVNEWTDVVRRFTADREISFWFDGNRAYSAAVPSDEKTVLEWDPDRATYPHFYRRFVLGANIDLTEWMKVMYASLLIYNRALSADEIRHNVLSPASPVRRNLVVWLLARPDLVKDVDGDGRPEWIDLASNFYHAKLYGASLVSLVKAPARVLEAVTVRGVAR